MDELIRERKRESSIPAQARIDIRVLAALDEYWMVKGVNIRTMSQLISWSLDLLFEVMSNNDELVTVFDTVGAAHEHLNRRGLYQSSMMGKGSKKVMHAIMFDNLRMEGVDPSIRVKNQYSMIHNKHSVEPSGMAESGYSSKQEKIKALTAQAMEIIEKQDNEELEKSKVESKRQLSEMKYDPVTKLCIQNELGIGIISPEQAKEWLAKPVVEDEDGKKSDVPRPKTEEELDATILEIEREDRIRAEKERNM
jgi:hypothetical protein